MLPRVSQLSPNLAQKLVAGGVTLPEPTTSRATPANLGLDVPTTKVLAIGSLTAKGTPDKWKPLLPSEARDTVPLYLAGKIDQW
jgi:hypothetical protein